MLSLAASAAHATYPLVVLRRAATTVVICDLLQQQITRTERNNSSSSSELAAANIHCSTTIFKCTCVSLLHHFGSLLR